jgi:hypothetical protein
MLGFVILYAASIYAVTGLLTFLMIGSIDGSDGFDVEF